MDNSSAVILPDPQLSDFIKILQIQFEYIDHIVSGDRVSNRNQKDGQIQSGFTPLS